MLDSLEFGAIALHHPIEPDVIPPESVKVFMPASDGGIKCIGFLYTDSSMNDWAASQGIRKTLTAGNVGTFPHLADIKRHLQALYKAGQATNRRLTSSINTVYDRAHDLETQARREDDIHTRDRMFTLKQYLDAFRAILEIGPKEDEIPR